MPKTIAIEGFEPIVRVDYRLHPEHMREDKGTFAYMVLKGVGGVEIDTLEVSDEDFTRICNLIIDEEDKTASLKNGIARPSRNIPEPGNEKPTRQEWQLRKTAYGMEVGVAYMYIGVELKDGNGNKVSRIIDGVQVALPHDQKLGCLFVIRANAPEAAMWDNPDRSYDCVKSYEPFEASIDDALAWIETEEFIQKHVGPFGNGFQPGTPNYVESTENGCIVIMGRTDSLEAPSEAN